MGIEIYHFAFLDKFLECLLQIGFEQIVFDPTVFPAFTGQLHKLSAQERFRLIKSGIIGTKRRVA